MKRFLPALALLFLAAPTPTRSAEPPASQPAAAGGALGEKVPPFVVRPGYRVTLAAEGLGHARFLEFGDGGVLYVAEMDQHRITALRDKDGDGFYETATPFVTEQRFVQGMSFRDGWLWFAPSTEVCKARDTDGDGKADEVVKVLKDLPGRTGHLYRALFVDGDGLYTAMGDSGNVNDETQTDREKIWRYHLDGTGKALFASGIRNTEKLRYRPGTTELWGCDHGSDNFGGPLGEKPPASQPVTDLQPPDELNRYTQGGFYGHPFITGNRVPRIEFQRRPDILELAAKTTPPAWSFGAHWATNGFAFLSLTNAHFPADHRGDLFVACHGSWNSTIKVGYRIERVLFDRVSGRPYGALPIVSTLSADGQKVLGRPVDLAEAPDGSLLFSDDWQENETQRIYRITWVGEGK